MRIFLLLAVLISAFLLFFFFRSCSPFEDSPSLSKYGYGGRASIRSANRSVVQENSEFVDTRLELKNSEWNVSDLSEYLIGERRSASSLSISFLITRDLELLAELKSHQDSKIALQLLASCSNLSPEERLLWAEKLHNNEPENGIGYLYMARAYAEMGDISSFKEALEASKNSPKIVGELKGMKEEFIELANSVSLDKQVSLLLNEVDMINTISVNEIVPEFLQGALSEMSEEAALQTVSSYLSIIESLRGNASLALTTAHLNYNTPESILKTRRESVLASLAVHSLELMDQVDQSLLPEILVVDSKDAYLELKNLTPDESNLIVERILNNVD